MRLTHKEALAAVDECTTKMALVVTDEEKTKVFQDFLRKVGPLSDYLPLPPITETNSEETNNE